MTLFMTPWGCGVELIAAKFQKKLVLMPETGNPGPEVGTTVGTQHQEHYQLDLNNL